MSIQRNEIFLVEESVVVKDELVNETLIVMAEPGRLRTWILLVDGAPTEKKIWKDFFSLRSFDYEVKVLCPPEHKFSVEKALHSQGKGKFRVASYRKKCQWIFDKVSFSLKMKEREKVRVLIVDDSKTICELLKKVLGESSQLEVVGALGDPTRVEEEIKKLKPDVMTLDIHMPQMTGIEVLSTVIPKFHIPTVMISSVGIEEGSHVLTALRKGAVDYIQKPTFDELEEIKPVIIEKVLMAADVDVKRKMNVKAPAGFLQKKNPTRLDPNKIICIGSSTGGTEAIRQIFQSLPKEFPPIVVTQHIPPMFSLAFAESLAKEFSIAAFEAVDGQEVLKNQVLIAPGGKQMELYFDRGHVLRVRVFDGKPVNRHKPSVDVLFDSAANVLGRRAVGVILTGMGADGAKGLLKMKDKGSVTIGQSEDTCVVYGMPRVASEIGAVQAVAPLNAIASEMLSACEMRKAA